MCKRLKFSKWLKYLMFLVQYNKCTATDSFTWGNQNVTFSVQFICSFWRTHNHMTTKCFFYDLWEHAISQDCHRCCKFDGCSRSIKSQSMKGSVWVWGQCLNSRSLYQWQAHFCTLHVKNALEQMHQVSNKSLKIYWFYQF